MAESSNCNQIELQGALDGTPLMCLFTHLWKRYKETTTSTDKQLYNLNKLPVDNFTNTAQQSNKLVTEQS